MNYTYPVLLSTLIVLLSVQSAHAGTMTITLSAPSSGSTNYIGIANFTYTPISQLTMEWCRLYTNDTVIAVNTNVTNSTTNTFSDKSLTNGTWNWVVECMDNETAKTNSSVYTLKIRLDTTAPTLSVNVSSASIGDNYVNFSYVPIDNESGLKSCDLLINNSLKTTMSNPANNTLNTFTEIQTGSGSLTWGINCTDHMNNTIATGPIYLYVKLPEYPIITLLSPANKTTFTTEKVSFQYNVVSRNRISWCNFILNNVTNETNTNIVNNTANNFTNIPLTNGTWNWTIKCTDVLGNKGNSSLMQLDVDLTKMISSYIYVILISPANNSTSTSGTVTFEYTPKVLVNMTSCTLILNESTRSVNKSIVSNVTNHFTEEMSDGAWNWRISCKDSYNTTYNTETRTLNVKIAESEEKPPGPQISPEIPAGEMVEETLQGSARNGFIWTIVIYATILGASLITFAVVNEAYFKKLKSLIKLAELGPEKKQKLKDYIHAQIQQGHSKEKIREHLLKYNWSKKHVDSVFEEIEKERQRNKI